MTSTTEEWCHQFAESIRDWLVANGVDWDRTVAWPEIVLHDDGTFEVEQFYRNKDGLDELLHGFGSGALVTLNRYEYRVPIDPDLWAAYQHTRTGLPERLRREALERLLRHSPPAININGGETLVFVVRTPMEADVLKLARDAMLAEVPGVNVVFISGVDAVFAGPGPVSL